MLTHELDVYGAWIVTPVIAYLASQNVTADWYIFCTEFTVIRLNKVTRVLKNYDVDLYKVHYLLNIF